jgi:hypothetical protein
LLGAACFLVRRTWQDKPASAAVTKLPLNRVTPAPASARIRVRHAQLRDKNPVTWLVARDWGYALVVWLVTMVLLAAFLILLFTDAPDALWHGWSSINGLVSIALYLWVTAKACQLFAEARRSGALELLLASPLTSPQTAQGAWLGLVRLFAWPILLLTCLQLATAGIGRLGGWTGDGFDWTAQAISVVVSALVTPMNLIALSWFGLWMGLTSRNTLTATLKTIVFVQIIPWFVIYFLTVLAVPLLLLSQGWATSGSTNVNGPPLWFPVIFVLVPSALTLLKDVIFWASVRRKLFGQFRQLAMRSITPVHTGLPPVIKAP